MSGSVLVLAVGLALVAAVVGGGADVVSSRRAPDVSLGGATPQTKVVTGRSLSAAWAFRPDDLAALTKRSAAVVVATVTGIEPGPSIDDGSGEPGFAIPTQRIAFAADETWIGDVPAKFKLFKTGSQAVYMDGDPPYAVGERYLLFIAPREGDRSTWINPAPDGRLRLRGDTLEPLIDGPVGRALARRPRPDARRAVVAAETTR